MKTLVFVCMFLFFSFSYTFLNDTEFRDASILSLCAYCSKDQLIPFECGYCKLVKTPIKVHDVFEHGYTDKNGEVVTTYVYVAETPSRLIISFRGTEMSNIYQWISNFKTSLVPFANRGVVVHQGFYESWLSVKERVITILRKLPTKQMLFMGHSRGGGIASVAAAEIASSIPTIQKKVELITFGAPRVGKKDFAYFVKQYLENRVLRVVNRGDLIPHFPPHRILNYEYYTHFPTEVWILNDKLKKCNPANGEDTTCSYQLPNNEKNVGDHSLYPGGIYDCSTSVHNECIPNCVNGYCKDKKCVCFDGFSGPSCSTPDSLCNPPCIHGKCLRGNKCVCNIGFGGRSCNLVCKGSCYKQCTDCLKTNGNNFCSLDDQFFCNECNSRNPISNPEECERYCCQL